MFRKTFVVILGISMLLPLHSCRRGFIVIPWKKERKEQPSTELSREELINKVADSLRKKNEARKAVNIRTGQK